MKKYFAFVFIAIAMLGTSLALFACGGHTHACSDWVIITEATCTIEGLRKGKCDHCGEEMTEIIEKVPHVPYTIEGKSPTCLVDGISDGQICSVCGTELKAQVVIPATGHIYGEWRDLIKATCEYPGEQERICSVCGLSRETQETPALNHKWGSWEPVEGQKGKHQRICENDPTHILERNCVYSPEEIVDPTCTTEGYTLEICADCGDQIKTNIKPALNHLYNNWLAVIVDEDETEHEHWHYRDCERCFAPEARQQERCQLEQEGDEIAPTCTTAAYKKMVCQTCQAVHEAVIPDKPATGHTFEYVSKGRSPISSSHCQKCTTCQYETKSEECVLNSDVHAATCTMYGYIEYSCPVCHNNFRIQTGVSALGHKYVFTYKSDKQHEKRCERCQETTLEPCSIQKIDEKLPTCTTDGSSTDACSLCLETFTEKGEESSGHNWQWTNKTETQHTKYCDKCGRTETNNHAFEQIKHNPATCNEEETFVQKCLDCEMEITIKGKPGLGHVWQVDKITASEHQIHCLNCEERKQEAHDWADSNLCSICKHDAMTYKIQGVHCVVTNTDKLRCPNIVIPEHHKVLNENGEGYKADEYKVIGIEKSAFQFFTNDNIYIRTIEIPDTIEYIGSAAFVNCRNLKEFIIAGEGVSELKTIGDNAFANCYALTKFEAPQSLVSIGSGAFANCSSLVDIEVKDNDNLEIIGAKAFYNTAFARDEANWKYLDKQVERTDALYIGKHLIKARQVGDNTVFAVLDGTVSISELAFSDFVNLSKVILPSSLKVVDSNAFEKCENIMTVEFNGNLNQWLDINFVNDLSSPLYYGDTGLHVANTDSNVDLSDKTFTRIPAGTFRGITNLQSITLPKTLAEIGKEAFEDCTNLKTIDFNGGIVKVVGADAFKNCGLLQTDERGVAYVQYILVKADPSLAGNYVVKEGTITIADEAFKGCNLLTSVTIDDKTERVGRYAFADCSSMSSITFEDSSYYWLISLPSGFGRSYGNGELTWSLLQAYTGGWKRLSKAAAAA